MAVANLGLSNKILDDGDMSSSLSTDWVPLANNKVIYFRAVWSGSSPTGTFTVETTDNPAQDSGDTYEGSSVAITASGSQGWNIGNAGFPFARLKYTRVSGSGTMDVSAYVKE
jgi:hypothetical protein